MLSYPRFGKSHSQRMGHSPSWLPKAVNASFSKNDLLGSAQFTPLSQEAPYVLEEWHQASTRSVNVFD